MFDKLASKYLCIEPSEAQKDYHGRANPALDEPITVWELEYELTKMKKTANPYSRQPPVDLNIYIDGQEVPRPKEVRILGQILTQSGRNLSTINKLTTTTTHVVGMLRRIRNQRSGLKEKEAIQLVYAFVVSRVMYATPYLRLAETEVNKLNVIIRRAFKCALGLPEYVATEDLLSTGLYNTIEELWEAQRISQIKRLSETPNGRWLLERLQLATPGGILHQEPKQELTPIVRGKITVEKIPRNMNSERNANRRRVRAQIISRIWSKKPGTLYADAAILPRGNTATLAVADPRGNVVRTASVYTTLTEHAEEAAIALVATGTKQDHITVITDSQRACHNFAKGEIGEQAARILSKAQFTSMKIVWAKGHAGVEGNEAANAAARAFHSNRDSSAPQPHSPDPNMKYNGYLKTIREARMTLPAPPSKFTKEEEHLYRSLQTGTMKTPVKLHQWYPQLHPSPTCSFCGWKWGNLYHSMWVCKDIKGLDPIPNPTRDSWNAALRWSNPGSQHWLVRRATVVQAAIGAPD
ncbi:uncharacterized protein LOC120847475 [Ixodes scapularis]|uniref:uncharacterized protein LOC120847475 n=1 Tax=Ixodes scapularis TaxID=6945 RepID=UPI001A9D380F|nr:uncharacterized protein LOC120847475 [Ixodes scapularis]